MVADTEINSDINNETESNAEKGSAAETAGLSQRNTLILIGGLFVLVIGLMIMISRAVPGNSSGNPEGTSQAQTASVASTVAAQSGMPVSSSTVVTSSSSGSNDIMREGEGRLFYTTIQIPANAETLYLSGSGSSPDESGNWGDMETQTINTFNKFKATLEERGWSMADIVQVRAFAVAGEYGLLDFDGFNRGYMQFFGTEENPNKPVRSFVQVADLVVEGWLVEIEIRAARTPD